MISVVVPIYNEEKYIDRCVQSIVDQDYPHDDMEVVFADGMSTDRTREILSGWAQRYPFLRVVDNPQRTVSYALNAAIRAAQGDIIIRLDAHAVFPQNYFSVLVRHLETLSADNVGGVCRTLPADDTPLCRAIAAVLSHPFGMGNSYFRIGASEIREVDTVPFGCFRRSIFDKVGFFDEELIRNQDDEFNARIIQNGGKIYLIPQLVIDYFARQTVRGIASMFYQYGLFKPLVNKKLGKPATVRQFFPPLFVLGIVFGSALSFLSYPIAYAFSAVIALYLLISMVLSLRTALKEECPDLFFYMFWLFFIVHFCYGFGYLHGLVKILLHRKFNVESRR